MEQFNIYLDDFKPTVAEAIKKFLHLDDNENYDTFPIVILEGYSFNKEPVEEVNDEVDGI